MKKFLSLFLSVTIMFLSVITAFAGNGERSVYCSNKIPTGSVRMIAHRGYCLLAPENTLAAFELAGQYNFWGAECDICPTSDGVWVIMHDDTVDRMTDGEGKVGDFSYEEIRKLKIDSGMNVEDYPDEKIPTLTEYLDVCKKYGLHPVIEIKSGAKIEDMDSLSQLLLSREEKDMFTVISFERSLLAKIRTLMPNTPMYLLSGGGTEQQLYDEISFVKENNIQGIDFCFDLVEKRVEIIKEAGIKPIVWTVDDIKTVEQYYEWGVRDYTTNVLNQSKPEGNLFQRIRWFFRDLRYNISCKFDEIFKKINSVF